MKESLILSFIPLFVAMDPIGIVPLYLTLTGELNHHEKRKVVKDSVLTACVLGVVFVFGGKVIFQVLGISVADFAIAGGLLLFSISILNLVKDINPEVNRKAISSLGIFPIGTPIIVGPAVLTTLIILVDNHGYVPTLVSFGLNLMILGVALLKADIIFSVLGEGGARGFAKVMHILLAAIGIMMVRRGVIELISDFRGL